MAAVSENPVGDPAISSMLDEFEEGTLLSLLEDSDLFNYIQSLPLTPNGDPEEDPTPEEDLDLFELFGEGVLPECLSVRRNSSRDSVNTASTDPVTSSSDLEISPNVSRVGLDTMTVLPSPIHSGGSETDISNLDSNDSDSGEDGASPKPTKRRKLDSSSGASSRGGLSLRECVEHDHCYTQSSAQQQLLSPTGKVDKGVNVEEANFSDAGYDTMSSSTSPGIISSGTSGTSPPQASSSPTATVPQLTSPRHLSLPPLNSPHINPVDLIDARIKHFMRSQQVNLTEEEKETLRAEGLPIPTTLPLTKVEEKALKSVRRKIRNKVAAQESRKRKKEHMQDLEERVRQCTNENLRLQKKVETLQSENRSLMTQLKKFQAMVAGGTGNSRHTTTKVGACLMVVVLCFAVFMGSWAPQKHAYWSSISSDYATTSVRSRSLLSLETPGTTFPQAVCDWFRYTFLPDKHDHTHPPLNPDLKSDPTQTWPDVYLSSHTPLAVQSHNNSHNESHRTSAAVAA